MLRFGWMATLVLCRTSAVVLGTLLSGICFGEEHELFNFSADPTAARWWTNIDMRKTNLPDWQGKNWDEPDAAIQAWRRSDTSGDQGMRIAFEGGTWPTVGTSHLPPELDWSALRSLEIEIFADQPLLAGVRVRDDKAQEMVKTAFLVPGKNRIRMRLVPFAKPVLGVDGATVNGIDVFAYEPPVGAELIVSSVRASRSFEPAVPTPIRFTLENSEITFESRAGNCEELYAKMESTIKEYTRSSTDRHEAAIQERFAAIKQTHPRAVLAVFRDGELGWDSAHPENRYSGWRDTSTNIHPPDSALFKHADKRGHQPTNILYQRWGALLMKVDLSAIPVGSQVHAASMLFTVAGERKKPGPINLCVAEVCNVDWDEAEVNSYQYAKGKLWHPGSRNMQGYGMSYGDAGTALDSKPHYLAWGPVDFGDNVLDFTSAVRYWTNGQNENRGFFLHCFPGLLAPVITRENEDASHRPTLIVIYEPPEK